LGSPLPILSSCLATWAKHARFGSSQPSSGRVIRAEPERPRCRRSARAAGNPKPRRS
jgi:hypothetical protein